MMGIVEKFIYDKDDIVLMPYILDVMGECVDMRMDEVTDYICAEILESNIFEPSEQPLKTMCLISNKLFYSDYAIKEARISNVIKLMTGFIGKYNVMTYDVYEAICKHCQDVVNRW